MLDFIVFCSYIYSVKRDLYKNLLAWKSSPRRKPLILKGARQTGKTYLLKEFGKNEYDSISYFNFEENSNLNDFFKDQIVPQKIIENLSIYQKREICPDKNLIIFDEIQASNSALNSLKYFNEDANEYHIVAAGSLLGIKLSKPRSFPVGKVNFVNLFPLTFFEFLEAYGYSEYRKLIEDIKFFIPFPKPFHNELIDLLRIYYIVGGMPEAVQYFIEHHDLISVREIQNEIIDAYILDFIKHANPSEIPKLTLIWNSIPAQLGKENKKFVFSALNKSARAREYENAIQWLEDAGLIHRIYLTNTCKIPLNAFTDRNAYKVYALDVGLLSAMAKVPVDMPVKGNQIFNEYQGAFVENYIAQQLIARQKLDLYYWKSNGIAEVDFVCSYNNQIYPLEAKAGVNPRSKSLKVFNEKYSPNVLSRSTLLNLKHDGKIFNYPLYAIVKFPLKEIIES